MGRHDDAGTPNAPHPNCAYLWMERSLNPKVQGDVAAWFGSVPAVLDRLRGQRAARPRGLRDQRLRQLRPDRVLEDAGGRLLRRRATRSACPTSEWVDAVHGDPRRPLSSTGAGRDRDHSIAVAAPARGSATAPICAVPCGRCTGVRVLLPPPLCSVALLADLLVWLGVVYLGSLVGAAGRRASTRSTTSAARSTRRSRSTPGRRCRPTPTCDIVAAHGRRWPPR